MAKPPSRQGQQLKFFIAVIGFLMLFLLFQMTVKPKDEVTVLKFYEFVEATQLSENDPSRIQEVTFKENEAIGTRVDNSTVKTFTLVDADLRKELMDRGVRVNYEAPEEPSIWKSMLINWLPLIVLFFLFFFFMRQLQVGGGKAMSFGKSRAKMLNENQSKYTFKDVAGVDEAKQELQEIVDFLSEPKKFTRLGGRIPKGVLLIGPPGTGKTILAKAIAGEAGVPFFTISGSDFVEMFVGVGASRVRDLFEQAKRHAPCIVFIDEIDAVGRHRGAGLGGGHDEREQTLNQLLVEMDGFESNDGVILIAATNRADVLDPALLRPGRFDRRVVVPNPDLKGREAILKVHTEKTPMDEDVDIRVLAQGSPGFSGADLENLVNEAALIAARKDAETISMHHFELAKDKVLMGPERRSMILNEKEKRTTAYHEAGHALVALNVMGADPVHKISIIPRGQALGVTILLPEEDKVTMSKEQAEGMIAYAMGGRAGEELIFGHYTTGAGDDIKKATSIARKMVCNWGMSEKIGPLSLGKQQEEVFLGRELTQDKPYSERTAEEVDAEIRQFINGGYERALKILEEKRKILEVMAETLLIKEVLDRKEIERIAAGEEILTEEDRRNYEEAKRRRESPEEDTEAEKKSSDEAESNEGSVENSKLNPAAQGT